MHLPLPKFPSILDTEPEKTTDRDRINTLEYHDAERERDQTHLFSFCTGIASDLKKVWAALRKTGRLKGDIKTLEGDFKFHAAYHDMTNAGHKRLSESVTELQSRIEALERRLESPEAQ